MSRDQQGQVFKQAKGESTDSFGNAQNSLLLAQKDVGDYQKQLGDYAAKNPFTAGGEYETAQNKDLAATADAGATAAGARLQGITRRSGINPGAAVGATEEMQRQNTRDLSAEEAKSNENRISQEAEYNKGVLGATAVPVGMEESIAGGHSKLYGDATGAEEGAAKTPSFMDELGGAFSGALEKGLGTGLGKWLSPGDSGGGNG